MKPALLSLLGAAIAFLLTAVFLNWRHGGPDEFPGGSLQASTPAAGGDHELARLLPPEFVHACAVCGDCVHPMEILQNDRTLRLREHRRWFQLFKSADRTHYFTDLVALASCIHVRSARDPAGEWRITGRPGPARHSKAAPHDCGALPESISVSYELVVSSHPIEDAVSEDAAPFAVARSSQMMVFRYGKDSDVSLLHFGWRLQSPALGTPALPCGCGKP